MIFIYLASLLLFTSAVNIATVTVDTIEGDRIATLVSNYVRSHTSYNLSVSKKISNERYIDEISEIYKLINDSNVRDVFAYLPETNPYTLNDITSKYKIYTLNAVNHDIKICLKYTFYGFDTCYGKYLCI